VDSNGHFGVPSTATIIAVDDLADSFKLKTVDYCVDSQVETIDKYAFYESGIKSIHIPNKVRSIDKHAFSHCQSLASLKFAENSQLESIGASAFQDTILTSVNIPSLVSVVNSGAFKYNYALSTVAIACSTEPLAIGPRAFNNMSTENAECRQLSFDHNCHEYAPLRWILICGTR